MTPDLAQANRREVAGSLSAAGRLEILDSLIRGRPGSSSGPARANPELLGLRRFQVWLTESGRLADDGGSPWWREVNSLLLLDVVESTMAGPAPSDSVAAWVIYWDQRSPAGRTSAWWTAHQSSLHTAARTASDVLILETEAEQSFIALALRSVELAARARLPTGRVGSPVIGGFCRVFYPRSYPAGPLPGSRRHLPGWRRVETAMTNMIQRKVQRT